MNFIFSSATIVIGVIGGAYLFFEWLRHGRQHRFLLWWALGLYFLYWFQLPFILTNAGIGITVADYGVFFGTTFPLVFVGLVLIYLGILEAAPPKNHNIRRMRKRHLLFWIFAAFVIFGLYFSWNGNVTDRKLAYIAISLFFLPIYLLIFTALVGWFRSKDLLKTNILSFGIVLMMLGALFGIVQLFWSLRRVLTYPPEFWFLTLSSFSSLYVIQAVGAFLFLAGFLVTHRVFHGKTNGHITVLREKK